MEPGGYQGDALKVARERTRCRDATAVAAEHGGLHPLPPHRRHGAPLPPHRRHGAISRGNGARVCFQKGPTQLLKRCWTNKSDANGRTVNSVELTTVVAGHCGGCSLATVVACADGHGVAPDLGTARAARSECLFSRDRVKNSVACKKLGL